LFGTTCFRWANWSRECDKISTDIREKLLFCYSKSEEDTGCVNEQSIHAPACVFCVAVSKYRKTYKQPRWSRHGAEMNMIRERKTDL
jgi:hypothetical protein